LAENPALYKTVAADCRLAQEERLHVSHEDIDKTLLVQAKGVLKREWQARCAPSGRFAAIGMLLHSKGGRKSHRCRAYPEQPASIEEP